MLAKSESMSGSQRAKTDASSQRLAPNLQTGGWLLFTLLLCIHFALSYSTILDYLELDQYTQGLAVTPYQFRALPMFVFRMFVPTRFVETLVRHAPMQLRDPYQMVQFGIALCCIFVAVLATNGTLTKLTGNRWFARWFSLVLVYMAYFNLAPGWGLSYSFPYDIPSLMFFCLGVYLVVANRRWLYYLMFPLAVLNRETICFLTIFFAIWNLQRAREENGSVSRKEKLKMAIHVAAQAMIWIAVKAILAHAFAANPNSDHSVTGSYFSVRVLFNLHELVRPQQWPVYLSCCGFLLPALWLQRRWICCRGISRACAIILPLWFAGMMMVGVIPEIRIFSELSAFVVPALGLIVYNRFRARQTDVAEGFPAPARIL